MFETLSIFRTAHAMAVHAGERQTILAQNMANADTPDYSARDIKPFSEVVGETVADPGLLTTRATHLTSQGSPHEANVFTREGEHDPNGNSVSLEVEMLNAVDAKRQHDRALAIYKTSMGLLRTTLGRG